jgi:hypothetical protein
VEQPEVGGTTPKLQDVIAEAKPNVNDTESLVFEELFTVYGDITAMTIDYGPTDCTTL